MEWSIEKIRLDLKYTWKISRNASSYKENFIVKCSANKDIGLGEVAPNIRYNETPEGIEQSFLHILSSLPDEKCSVEEMEIFLQQSGLPNALKFGIESAFVHWHCKQKQIGLNQFLGIDKLQGVESCYTFPIMETGEIKGFYDKHQLNRFHNLKVKVNNEEAIGLIQEIHQLGNHQILIDANEAWLDVEQLIRFIPKLKPYPIAFIEQPMPAHCMEEYKHLKKHSSITLMGDESVLNEPDFDLLEQQFHGVNMKLMKAGSYLNGVRILKEAQKRNLTTMVGCMVETTLGIKGAWSLASLTSFADLDGCLIVDNEPFHLLREEGGYFYETTDGNQ